MGGREAAEKEPVEQEISNGSVLAVAGDISSNRGKK